MLTVQPVASTSNSTFTWVYSESISLSSPPLKGKFFLECYDQAGNPYYTKDLDYNIHTGNVKTELIKACPWLRDSVDVRQGYLYPYDADGIDLLIYLRGIKYSLNQFKIHPSHEEPIIGVNVSYESEMIDTYGENVYYDVIPFEQIYTYSSEPEVIVTLDDYPVLCKSTNCTYKYTNLTSEITSFSVAG